MNISTKIGVTLLILFMFSMGMFIGYILGVSPAWFLESLHETTYVYDSIDTFMNGGYGSYPYEVLPTSITNIVVKFHSDYNTAIISFRFDPSVKLVHSSGLKIIPDEGLHSIQPTWARPEKWFPEDIRLGHFDRIFDRGINLYVHEPLNSKVAPYDSKNRKEQWYIAFDHVLGIGYAWNKVIWE